MLYIMLKSYVFPQKNKDTQAGCLYFGWAGVYSCLRILPARFLRRVLLDNFVERSPYKQSTGLFVPRCARHGRLRIPPFPKQKAPQGCFLFWLGRRDSNPRMTESKSVALPLGDGPIYLKNCLFYKCSRTEKLCGFGDPSEIRTPDTLIKSQVLCQLS